MGINISIPVRERAIVLQTDNEVIYCANEVCVKCECDGKAEIRNQDLWCNGKLLKKFKDVDVSPKFNNDMPLSKA